MAETISALRLVDVVGGGLTAGAGGFYITIRVETAQGERDISIFCPLENYEELHGAIDKYGSEAARMNRQINPQQGNIGEIAEMRTSPVSETHIGLTEDGSFVVEARLEDGTFRHLLLEPAKFEALQKKMSESVEIAAKTDLTKIRPKMN